MTPEFASIMLAPADLTSRALMSSVTPTQVGAEFAPQIRGQAAKHAVAASDHGRLPRALARRQPRILDDVVHRVTGVSRPRRRHCAVFPRCHEDASRGIAEPPRDSTVP